MTIEITQMPETKEWTAYGKQYRATYPNGFPVNVRQITHCGNCGVEIGGFFGNKVYRYENTNLCEFCGETNDPIVQMCIRQTGLTPKEYQKRHKVAWNE